MINTVGEKLLGGGLSGLICLSADLSLELCLEHTEVQGQKH